MTNKFFPFNQNNSGGSFVVSDQVGHVVFIEAPDDDTANDIALDQSIEFNSGCECCGNRWRMVGPNDGIEGMFDEEDGPSLQEGAGWNWNRWGRNQTAHVYFLNGTHVMLKIENSRIRETFVHC
jgi:hypothetical protein